MSIQKHPADRIFFLSADVAIETGGIDHLLQRFPRPGLAGGGNGVGNLDDDGGALVADPSKTASQRLREWWG